MGNSAKHGGQERRITSEIKSGFEALPRQLAAQVAPQMNALLDEDIRYVGAPSRPLHPSRESVVRVQTVLCALLGIPNYRCNRGLPLVATSINIGSDGH